MLHDLNTLLAIALVALLAGCDDHSHDADGDHGHDHGGGAAVTQWNDKTEIFMEYPPLVAGQEGAFAIHLTTVSDFKPVTDGTLVSRFTRSDGESVEVVEDAPAHPGIYRPVVRIPRPGDYRMVMHLTTPTVSDTIIVEGVRVYPDEASLPHAEEAEDDGETIAFLKEQQWKIAFRSEPVKRRELVGSIAVVGELMPKTRWHAQVPAPADGVILADQNTAVPSIGTWVDKGQVLAVISPPASGEASLNRIRTDYLLARAEYERAQRLFEKEAIPEKRLAEARLRFEAMQAGYDVIASQVDFEANGDGSGGSHHFHLVAPIAGYLEEITFHMGETVQAGQALFKITNPRRLLLKANVPAARISRLPSVGDAAFRIEGYEREFVVSDLDGRLLSVGSLVSESSRTVPVYFEFANPDNLLKIGMFAEVSLKTGEPVTAPAIPRSAIFDEDGTPVAYVHVGGESFEKRTLETGITDRGYTEIISGLTAGERVVTEGGYQVRLASMSTTVPTGHGHAH